MRMMTLRTVQSLDYATTEAINTLATNVIFSGAEYKTIMMTSCAANEGKSFVTFHLAEKLASLGYSVMLVDADLRKSVFVSRYDAVTQGPLLGLTHYLAGRCELEDIQYRTNIENLSVIPIGKEVINSLPLLNSAGFVGLMKELRRHYHFVLVDAPPVGVIIDAAMIANICDGTLFVVTNEMVSKRELVSAVQQIQKSGCTVLGVILNKVEMDTHKSKKYYYKSYYSHYQSSDYAPSEERQEKKAPRQTGTVRRPQQEAPRTAMAGALPPRKPQAGEQPPFGLQQSQETPRRHSRVSSGEGQP